MLEEVREEEGRVQNVYRVYQLWELATQFFDDLLPNKADVLICKQFQSDVINVKYHSNLVCFGVGEHALEDAV